MVANWKDKEVYKTIQLAIPIIMGELAQMSLHLIDTAMVGAISLITPGSGFAGDDGGQYPICDWHRYDHFSFPIGLHGKRAT
ncbi:MAG: hypothetical protein WDM78_11840 [Puia sp.]